MNGQTRYHAEIKVTVLGREARINVFADTLAEIFSDLGKITEQIPDSLAFAAKREIVNAELKAKQTAQEPAKPPKKDAKPAKADVPPTCNICGMTEHMELIKWTDKQTGAQRQAWKCQNCEQWYFPNGQ